MKICWDVLEKLEYNKNCWYTKFNSYFYFESCKNCGDDYLGHKNQLFCSRECNLSYPVEEESKKKMSKTRRERKLAIGSNNGMYNKKHLEESKKMMSINSSGEKNYSFGKKQENCSNWKGGVKVTRYDTVEKDLINVEEIRRSLDDKKILEVRCKQCNKWFKPTGSQTNHRIQSIKGNRLGDSNFYCSDECKLSCSIYKKVTNTPGSINDLENSVWPELRKLVLERDNYECQKCGLKAKTKAGGGLHCHHINPVKLDPLESADIDNCIILCVDCHKEAHQKDGCKTGQLARCIII